MSEKSIPLQISGSLREVPVADLARLLQSARLTGGIQLYSGACIGTLYFRRGDLVEAAAYRASGVSALKIISLMCRGRFEFRPSYEIRSESLAVFSTEELIRYLEVQMEFTRQLQELTPASEEIPRFMEGTAPEGFEFSEEEIAVALQTSEGNKSIRKLAIEMGITELEVGYTVARFRAAGLMEMIGPDINSPPISHPPEESPVDITVETAVVS